MSADEAPTPAEVAAPRPGVGWKSAVVALFGVAVLVGGAVVFALGQSASSTASDDLVRARNRHHDQRSKTGHASEHTEDVRAALDDVAQKASELLATADQIAVLDAEIVRASQEELEAGVVLSIERYNAAVADGDVAIDAYNALLPTLQSQLSAFDQALISLAAGSGQKPDGGGVSG